MDIRTWLLFFISLGIIVTIHEFGHLIMAKLFGVYCHEFSIGMGPKIYSFQGRETMYSLRLLPIGGYVAMAGESNDELFKDKDLASTRYLNGIHPFKRILVLLAGVFMNFALYLLLMTIVIANQGVGTDKATLQIGYVAPGSVAERAGVQVDDVFKGYVIDGERIVFDTYAESEQYAPKDGQLRTYIFERNGQEIEIQMAPELNSELNRYLVGISYLSEVRYVNVFEAFVLSAQLFVKYSLLIFSVLLNLFRGRGLENLSGPVGIFMAAKQVSGMGLMSAFNFVAILSLNVGVFNLLPIPALDGGRIILVVAEWIKGEPLEKKFEERLISISFFLLLALIVFIIFKDIVTFF